MRSFMKGNGDNHWDGPDRCQINGIIAHDFEFLGHAPKISRLTQKTIRDAALFVYYVRSRPGQLMMASPGTGSAPYLAEMLFLQMAALKMTHVPYRGYGRK